MMRHITLKIFSAGGLECHDMECPWKRKCANHMSAGDFRAEDGMTPELKLESFTLDSETKAECAGETTEHNGAARIRNGELVRVRFDCTDD